MGQFLTLDPGFKLEPVYPTNHGYISNLAGKKYNLPVTLTGKKNWGKYEAKWTVGDYSDDSGSESDDDEESSESEED